MIYYIRDLHFGHKNAICFDSRPFADVGEMENIMIAKEAIEMILNGSRHKSVYGFLEHKKETLKMKEFKDLVGIEDDKIEFKDGIEFDEKDFKESNS